MSVAAPERPTGAADPTALPRLLQGAPLRSPADHLRVWGPLPRPRRAQLLAEVEAAGLTGRGGAGFPLAAKLAAASHGPAGTVVVNATEGEPVSAKDATLLAASPHLVLDGATAAAHATGAAAIVVCLKRSHAALARQVEEVVGLRRRAGLDPVRIQVTTAPDRYVAGQETALVRWLDGGEARPTTVPPRPTSRGVGRRPTLVSNAETLAHLALIARFGAAWFRSLGRPDAPGTTLATLSGDVRAPGVYEVPLGAPLGELIAAAGGDPAANGGVLVGGYFGAWVGPAAAAAPFCAAGLRPFGAAVGCGAVAVLPAGVCGLLETARVLRWLAGESAGQCGPCVNGLPAMADAFDAVVAGDPGGAAEAHLVRWAGMVERRGACALPDGAARLVRSALQVFAADAELHRRRGPCRPAPPVLPTPTPGGWR